MTNPPKTIILLIPNLGRGGAQKVFRDQLKFYSLIFRVIPCVFNWDGSFESDRLPGMISLDVRAGRNKIDKVIRFFQRVIRLRRLKKQFAADVCISHLEGADYVNILSRQKEKVICWIHGTKRFDENIEGSVGTLRKTILIPFLYKKSDLIVTVSKGIRDELLTYFSLPPSKIKNIPNGFFVTEMEKKGRESDSNLISVLEGDILITHCRLERQKNLSAMIDIYSLVKSKKPSVKLVILGDGELRNALIRQCESLGLDWYGTWTSKNIMDRFDVYFMGYQMNPFQFLTRATLYLLTSGWEGFPLSLCEAMACRLPVLATDCYTGPREILAQAFEGEQPLEAPLKTQVGFLMPLADSEKNLVLWAETIEYLLSNGALRKEMSISGNERVKDFDYSNITDAWLKII